MKQASRILVFALFYLVMINASAEVFDLGQTYPISERSPSDELKEAANNVDWKKLYEEKIRGQTLPIAELTRAQKNRTITHTPVNIIDMDVVNPRTGEVMYPKGYSYNPLDFMRIPRYVVISDDKRDLEWLKKQTIDYNTMILTVSDPFDLTNKLEKKVMILTDELKDKLKLEHYPVIAEQVGNQIRVTEYFVQ